MKLPRHVCISSLLLAARVERVYSVSLSATTGFLCTYDVRLLEIYFFTSNVLVPAPVALVLSFATLIKEQASILRTSRQQVPLS